MLLNSVNTKNFYKLIKQSTAISSDIPSMKDEHGNLTVSDKNKASMLNKYFSSLYTSDNDVIPVI